MFDVLKAWSSTNRKYYKLEILEMPFVEGHHTPTSVQHIHHLCSALGKLHAKTNAMAMYSVRILFLERMQKENLRKYCILTSRI